MYLVSYKVERKLYIPEFKYDYSNMSKLCNGYH